MSSVSSVPPLVESLTMTDCGWDRIAETLNSEPTTNSEIAARRKLREHLDRAVKIDPVEERYDLYRSLTELLGTGTNDRFVLYCPLFLVPDAAWYRQYDESVDSFAQAYVASWFRMLDVHDVRANFVDGDVPDIELGVESLEMVVQAACLAPYLAAKGLISENQLPSDDPVLTQSLARAFSETEQLQNTGWSGTTSLAHHVAVELHDSYEYGGVSQKRAKWLRWDRRRRSIRYLGKALGPLLAGGLDPKQFGELDTDSAQVAAIGMGTALEQTWLTGNDTSIIDKLYRRLEPYLTRFVQDDALRDIAASVLCRLHSIGVAKKQRLDELGIFLPNLNGPLHPNLEPIGEQRAAIRKILADDALRKIIYPAAIVFGSRLKGYGGPNADIDLAVFIRPQCFCDAEDRAAVTELLRSRFGQPVVEYWLQEDKDELLRVYDPPELAANVGDSSNAHVLLGGAWEGELSTISMLGERLLMPYLRERNEAVRGVWLREMERDLLQYRLLHRGFEKFHVPRTDVFLDDGYRLIASQLYASHVFIPHVN